MKKALLAVLAALMLTAFGTLTMADDAADLQALKDQVKAMQDKISALEAKQAAAPAAAPAGAQNVTFNGYFRGRLHTSEADGSTWESTEFALQPKWDASDKIHGEVHVWFWPSANAAGVGATYVEAGFMQFDEVGIGKGSKLLVGKDRNWCYGITPVGAGRKTSTYSLYESAITQARVTGLQSINKLDNGKVDLNVAILNGYTMGTRLVGTASYIGSPQLGANGTSVIANKDMGYDTNNSRGISFRLAGKVTPSLKIGGNFYTQKLAAAEIATMDIYSQDVSRKSMDMIGLDFDFNDGTWMLQGEYTALEMGSLDGDAFQILGGVNINDKNSAYIKYGQVDYDRNYDLSTTAVLIPTPTTANPAATTPLANYNQAWDKSQVVLSYKYKLSKKAWLQLEHEFNLEDEPENGTDYSARTDNDITFLEFMTVY